MKNAVNTGYFPYHGRLENLKNLIQLSDVQVRCGFNTPQAIFKWMRGDAVPTIDNLIILADMFDVPIDKIIIVTRI